MADKKPTCFVIMPITMPAHLADLYGSDPDHFDDVYEHLFAPAIEEAGFKPEKPVAKGSVEIKAGIIKQLVEADLVLCDMSTLNANVFFELGARTALNKPVAMVRDAHLKATPFDLSGINYHIYDPDPRVKRVKVEIPKLASHLTATWEADQKANALWKTYGVQLQGAAPPAGGETELMTQLRGLVNQLTQHRNSRSERSVARDGSVIVTGQAPVLNVIVERELSASEIGRVTRRVEERSLEVNTVQVLELRTLFFVSAPLHARRDRVLMIFEEALEASRSDEPEPSV